MAAERAEQRLAAVESAIMDLKGAAETLATADASTRGVVDGVQAAIAKNQEMVGKVVGRIDGIENGLSNLSVKLQVFENGLATQKAEFTTQVDEQLSAC